MKRATLKDIMAVDTVQLNKMNKKELQNYVRNAADIANKRVDRAIEKGTGDISPSIRAWQEAGGVRFSSKGKTLNQLRKEFVREQNFLSSKTSLGRGIKKYERKIEELIGRKDLTDDEKSTLFANYRNFEKWQKKNNKERYGSSESIKAFFKEDVQNQIRNIINEKYETQDIGSDTLYIDKVTGEIIKEEDIFNVVAHDIITERAFTLLPEDPAYAELSEETFKGPNLA